MLFTVSGFLTALLGFLGIGSLGIKEYQKQFDAINYGVKVDVDGLNMNVVIQGDQNNQTIVLLPGIGVVAPYITYKSLTEPLSESFKVITVEPFGYGLSDVTEKERTNENIITELHTCLQKIGINQFYLMGHSIGGLYSLAYVNKYSDEVLGFIGLDNSINNNEDEMKSLDLKTKILYGIGKIIAKNHLNRFAPEKEKEYYIKEAFDPNYKFTEEDMKNFDIIFGYHYNSENIINEDELFKDNVASLHGATFKCPALMFLAKEDDDDDANQKWVTAHEIMIGNHENSRIIELEGSHMIYINQTEEIVKDIKEWIK